MKKNLFVVAAIMIGSLLPAQQDTSLLDEVVITANKFPNKTSLTGKVVLVITREQLEKSGGKDLSQLLSEQAGIYIGGSNSNPGKDKSIYLRGARVDHTLITIDGIPVYDPSGIGSNFDIRNLSADQVERIEILKGSQSTLYGSDAIAGVINIITRKQSGKVFSINSLLNYGSNNSFRTNTGVNGTTGVIDYNLSYSFFDTKGINEAEGNSVRADKDGFQQNSLLVDFSIKGLKKFSLSPFVRFNRIEGDLDQGAFTDELDYTYTQKSFQSGIRNELQLGKTRFKVLYNYNYIDRLYIDDSIKSRNGFDTYSRGSYKGKEYFIDAFITIPFGGNGSVLTAGIDHRNSQTDQEYFSVGFFGPYTSKYDSDSLHQNQTGLYAALNIQTKDGFNLELGNRLNFHSEYGSNDVFNFNPSFLLKKRIKLFANLSSAYRTPSLYQLYSEYGNKSLEPEMAFTTEAGVQYFSTNNKISSRITYFSRNVRDVIFFYFNSLTFQSQYINQDKQKDHGAEFEISYKAGKNILLKGFYSYVTGKINTIQNGKDTVYFNLLRRPKHSIGISAGIYVTPRLHISSNLLWFDRRNDVYFDSQTFQTINTTLGSYFLLNLYSEYSFSKTQLKMFADLRNITNSRYNEVAGFRTLGFNGYGGLRFSL